jgi:hypothetical protein
MNWNEYLEGQTPVKNKKLYWCQQLIMITSEWHFSHESNYSKKYLTIID